MSHARTKPRPSRHRRRACHFEENFTCLCLTSEGATYSPAKDTLAAKVACLRAACVEIKSSIRLQCARMRPFRREIFCRASRTRREQSIRPKISQNDFDLTELERFEETKIPLRLKVLKEFSLQPEGDLRERIVETLEQHEERGLARFLEGAVRVATAILEMTSANREYAARVFKNTRANHSEIKAFFDCALKGLPFDLALRTTIRACPRCTMFFNLIKASVQAHVPAPARLCPEVPSACDHPSVTTAEGLIVLANWPPRPI